MGHHRITRGLDLPIRGRPAPTLEPARAPSRVALLAADYVGLRPTLHVQVGDPVRRGQVLFTDKKIPGVRHTAPGAGRVAAIHRGERRALQSVVIALSDSERTGRPADDDFQKFDAYTGQPVAALGRDRIRDLLVESGLWTALRARPFGRVADPAAVPRSLFVTAIDTNPLAPPPDRVIEARRDDFQVGLDALSQLTDGPTFVCTGPGLTLLALDSRKIRQEVFEGPHPAGTVGLHIHRLDPVCRDKVVWHVGYQDVLAVGRLFATGRLDLERVVSLAGPVVRNPRLLSTRAGAALDEGVAGELMADDVRVISGSVLSGRTAMGDVLGYLGRYHVQVSALRQGGQRHLFGWAMPGLDRFSAIRTCLSGFWPRRLFDFTTSTNGGRRAIVPIGLYERVMPMDIQPTYLLRSLLARDAERAEQLGALELEEEDLALCAFVCPGKGDYGPILRENLEILEKEG